MGVTVYRQYLARPTALDVGAVRALCRDQAMAGPVAGCSCGGFVFVDCPVQAWVKGGPVWVHLVCRSCGRETACPDGRLAPWSETALCGPGLRGHDGYGILAVPPRRTRETHQMPAHNILYTDASCAYISFGEFIRLSGLVAAGAADAGEIAAQMIEWGTRIELTEREAGCDVAGHTAAQAYNAYWTHELSKTCIGEDVYQLECDALAMWTELIEETARAVDYFRSVSPVPAVDAGVRHLHIVR